MKLILLLLCSINNWLTCIILVMCSMLVNNLCFQVLSGINHNLKWWATSHRIQRICVKYFFSGFCLWHLIKHWMGRGGEEWERKAIVVLNFRLGRRPIKCSDTPFSLSLSLSLSPFFWFFAPCDDCSILSGLVTKALHSKLTNTMWARSLGVQNHAPVNSMHYFCLVLR